MISMRSGHPMSTVLALLLVVAAPLVGRAEERDPAQIYETPVLREWQARYTRSMNRILAEGFAPVYSAREQRAFAAVKLDFPLRDDVFLNFHTEGKSIVLPVDAMHWLDEMSLAYAWLVLNNFQLEPTEEYVAMLRQKKPEAFPGGVYPGPLRALGIPANALSDGRVDGLSLRLFNSARAFILAHELGHVYLEHRESSVKNEEEADRFAIDLMRRTATVPMGIALYFQSTALWFQNAAPTHPLNARRLRTLSATLASAARAFGRGDADEVTRILFISKGLEQVADYLDDALLQRCVAESVARADPRVLAPRPRGAASILSCARRP